MPHIIKELSYFVRTSKQGSVIFISHSSKDNAEAEKIRDWLLSEGWAPTQIYLDLDRLNAGMRWRQALNEAGSACDAVIVCLSDSWLASDECRREFHFAEALNRPIFPIYVNTIESSIPRFISDLQIADIRDTSSKRGFEQLRRGLIRHGVSPELFPWPPPGDPQRSVYRGLLAYEECDAAVLFGRTASIAKAVSEVRGMRSQRNEKCLAILAASGAGKSSFLRAGLLPRLKRDDAQFIALPVIKPERDILEGTHGLNNSISISLGRKVNVLHEKHSLRELFGEIREISITAAKTSAGTLDIGAPPTIILSIDQGEDLFQSNIEQARTFLRLVTEAVRLDNNTIVIFTIRSNSFELLQRSEFMAALGTCVFNLPPIAAGSLGEIVEGPARLSTPPIRIDPALTQYLLTEIDSPDALPWLSFALHRLTTETSPNTTLSLDVFRTRLGSLNQVIDTTAEAALADLNQEEVSQLPWLMRQLVEAKAPGSPANLSLLSLTMERTLTTAKTLLIEKLIAARVLVAEPAKDSAAKAIRIAHEAVLRGWKRARTLVEQDQEFFAIRAAINQSLLLWTAGNGSLLRDASLLRAEELRDHFPEELSDAALEFILASRRAVDAAAASELRRVQELAEERSRRAEAAELLASEQVRAATLARRTALMEQARADLAEAKAVTEARLTNQERKTARLFKLGMIVTTVLLVASAFWGVSAYRSQLNERVALLNFWRGESLNLANQINEQVRLGALKSALSLSLQSLPKAKAELDRPLVQQALTAAARALIAARGLTSLSAPSNDITSFAPSSRGFFVTGDASGTVRVVSTTAESRGLEVMRYVHEPASVVSVGVAEDGRHGVAIWLDGKVSIWDSANWERPLRTTTISETPTVVAVQTNRSAAVVGTQSGTVILYDDDGANPLPVVHRDAVSAISYDRTGNRVITAARDGTLAIWSVVDKSLIMAVNVGTSPIWDARAHPSGHFVVVASATGQVTKWDLKSGLLSTIAEVDGGVFALSFSADGKRLLTQSEGTLASVWRAEDGRHIRSFSNATVAQLSVDGENLAVLDLSGLATLFEVSSGRVQTSVQLLEDRPVGLSYFSPTEIVAAALNGQVTSWSPVQKAQLVGIENRPWSSAVLSPDANFVVLTTWSGIVNVWNLKSGLLEGDHVAQVPIVSSLYSRCWPGPLTVTSDGIGSLWGSPNLSSEHKITLTRGTPPRLLIDPSCKFLLSLRSSRGLEIRNLSTGSIVMAVPGEVTAAAFDTSGTRLAWAGAGGVITLNETTTGRSLAEYHLSDAPIALAFVGQELVAAGKNGNLSVWRLDPNETSARTQRTIAPLSAVHISEQAGLVVAANWDGKVQILSLSDLSTQQSWMAPSPVSATAVDAKSGILLTGSQSGGGSLWNISTGELIVDFPLLDDAVVEAQFGDHAKLLLLRAANGTVRIYPGLGQLQSMIKEIQGRLSLGLGSIEPLGEIVH